MVLSTTVVTRGLRYDIINLTSGIYYVRKAFLEGQISEDKSTPLLAIKTTLLPIIFLTHSHLFLHKSNYKSLT